VITSWSFQAAAATTPELKFKVARPAGGDNLTIVGSDGPRTPTPGVLNTYATQIPVQAGDVIGTYRVVGGLFGRSASSAYSVQSVVADPSPGDTAPFTSPGPGFQVDVSATLEADCDADTLGDESQDADIASCTPDVVSPVTTITKGPKNKSTKKKASFEFASSEPGSTFLCSFDGEPSAVCTSPVTRKVTKGIHHFSVVAVDAVGNADATPAEDVWKVKKKKKK
jgi:hypothetical protein